MRIGIVVFPGSNCDRDCYYAIENVLHHHAVPIWHQEYKLPKNLDMIVLPGGFSYGDYLRAGAIATFTHVMDQIKEYADKGKLLLGICNGFQVLTESHLLPGTLIRNRNLRFVCEQVFLKVKNAKTQFTHKLKKDQVIKIPIAHGEGNYFIDDAGLTSLKKNDQIVFQYASQNGLVSDEFNPNGSVDNIAGIMNKNGNILGLMPHPERAVENLLGSEDGLLIFQSAFEILASAK